MERRISDTCTMHFEICYVDPQSGRKLLLSTQQQPPAGSVRFATAKIYHSTTAKYYSFNVYMSGLNQKS